MRRILFILAFACILPLFAVSPQLVCVARPDCNILFSINPPFADSFARITAAVLTKQAALDNGAESELQKDIAALLNKWEPQAALISATFVKDAVPGCTIAIQCKKSADVAEIHKLIRKHDTKNQSLCLGVTKGKLILLGGVFTVATACDDKVLMLATTFQLHQALKDLDNNKRPVFTYAPAQKIPANSRFFGFVDNIEPLLQFASPEQQTDYQKYAISNLLYYEEKTGEQYVFKATCQCKDTENAKKILHEWVTTTHNKTRFSIQGNTVEVTSEPYSLSTITPQQEKILEDLILQTIQQDNKKN